MNPCPYAQQTETTAHAATLLAVQLRQLKRTRHSHADPKQYDCPPTTSWHRILDTAIRDIAEEWGLL